MTTVTSSEALGAVARRQPAIVLVSVYTTSGSFPRHGTRRVRATRIVNDFLKVAARKLRLTDTTGWIVSADGRDINPALSFAENGLAGTVTLNWGPREGGGGS